MGAAAVVGTVRIWIPDRSRVGVVGVGSDPNPPGEQGAASSESRLQAAGL